MAAICPPRMPIPPGYRGEPVPSMMCPCVMTTSKGVESSEATAAGVSAGSADTSARDRIRRRDGRTIQAGSFQTLLGQNKAQNLGSLRDEGWQTSDLWAVQVWRAPSVILSQLTTGEPAGWWNWNIRTPPS